MVTSQEKAQCVSWFTETQIQQNYRTKYGKYPQLSPSIHVWHKKFMEAGTVLDERGSGRPKTSEENIIRA